MSVAAPILPPPLRDGDRLTSDEFLQRWEAMPDLKFAELIDGVVCMASPVSVGHSRFHWPLTVWLGTYATGTPGLGGSSNGTWLMGEGNVPQPDITLDILPTHGGQARTEGEYNARCARNDRGRSILQPQSRFRS